MQIVLSDYEIVGDCEIAGLLFVTTTCLMTEVLKYVPVFTRSDRKHATIGVFV